VCPERHVAGMIPDDSMWMGGTVVEELCEGFHGGFGAFCLLRGQSTECCEHGGIDGPGIVEEYPDDFLDMFAICCVQGWGGVGVWCKLGFGTIVWLLPRMWGMFWTWWMQMLEALECSVNVSWHG